jgi:hypothetical protein
MLLLAAGMPFYDLLLNATQAPFSSPQCTTPALLHADPGLVLGVQPFVDRVETCNLRGGRPIVEGCQWPIMELSLHSPHPIGRVLAFSIRLHRHGKDEGCTYCGMMLWGTGGALVEGGQGLNCRVKARVDRSTMFFNSFSNVRKLSTPHDQSFAHTPTIQVTDSWKLRHPCRLRKCRIP